MEVEFRTTIDDYVAFYQYFYFRRKLGWRILIVVGASLLLNANTRGDRPVFTWTRLLTALLMAAFIIVVCYVVPYIRTIRKTRKMLPVSGLLDPMKMILTTDGLTVSSEGEAGAVTAVGSWRWERVKFVDCTDRFVFIMLFQWKVFLIPRSCFNAENEVDNFIGIIRTGMVRVRGYRQDAEHEKAKRLAYWGLLGFIPNFGVIAGLVLLIQGIFRYKNRNLIIIGLADILFTIVFWTAIEHWVFHSPSIRNMEKQLAQTQLNTVFKNVEFYKIQHGNYPDSLQQIEDLRKDLWISDALPRKGSRLRPGHYYYQKTGDKYWLFSVGDDGLPFTADDMYPAMNPADSTKFGLRLR